jgi:hypothetical protein
MTYPTQSRLKELLDYDPETGIFKWKKERQCRGKAGEVAGNLDKDGYLQIGIDYSHCRAHRLAFIYMTGEQPPLLIDHLDGDGANNRWTNLRAATHRMNCENIRRPRAKTGLPIGVKRSGRGWLSRIRTRGREVHLGTFDSIADAASAYLEAKRKLHEGCTL